jgi:uncharacterized protein YcfL
MTFEQQKQQVDSCQIYSDQKMSKTILISDSILKHIEPPQGTELLVYTNTNTNTNTNVYWYDNIKMCMTITKC